MFLCQLRAIAYVVADTLYPTCCVCAVCADAFIAATFFATLSAHGMSCALCSPLHVCNQQDCDMPNGKEGTDAEIIPCRRCAVAYHRAHIPEAILAPQDGLIRSWFVKYDDQGKLLSCVHGCLYQLTSSTIC